MTVVRGLVKRGITICATIHCPPPHTFTLFDRALIMQRGRVVYFGLNGQPAIDYFYDHFPKARISACSRSFPLRWTPLCTKVQPQGVLAQWQFEGYLESAISILRLRAPACLL